MFSQGRKMLSMIGIAPPKLSQVSTDEQEERLPAAGLVKSTCMSAPIFHLERRAAGPSNSDVLQPLTMSKQRPQDLSSLVALGVPPSGCTNGILEQLSHVNSADKVKQWLFKPMQTSASPPNAADTGPSPDSVVTPLLEKNSTSNLLEAPQVLKAKNVLRPPTKPAPRRVNGRGVRKGLFMDKETSASSEISLSVGDMIIPFDDLDKENSLVVSDTNVVIEGIENMQEDDLQFENGDVDWTNNKRRKRSATSRDESPAKKRSRNPSKTKAAQAKLAHNTGAPHTSLRGKQVNERVMGVGCDEKCRQKCQTRITIEARKEAFDKFWGTGEKVLQWCYINKCVSTVAIKRRRITVDDDDDEDFFRKLSYQYYLPSEGEMVPVCMKMFLNTFNISKTVVKNALRKNSPDKRGRHKLKRRRLPLELVVSVKDHIKSFPLVESHYCRKDSRKKYLDEKLNVARMHRMYCAVRNDLPNTANLRQYRDIFNTCFNISFFKPKKDKCADCAEWDSMSPHEKSIHSEKHDQHIKMKEQVRSMRREDKMLSRREEPEEQGQRLRVVTFDLQKVLYVPKTEVGDFFYKRKLSNYNFSIFDCTVKQALNYFWDQTTGQRGSNEISSFVYSYMENLVLNNGVKEFRFYSDSCAGQNKNQFLYSMYYFIAMKYGLKIIHRYLVKGHTQMECDSVHARIEKKIRNIDIYVPSQYMGYISTAKVKPPLYKTTAVKQDQIYSFRDLSSNFKWSKVPLSKITEITFDSAQPGRVTYRCDFDSPQTEVEVLCKRRGRPINWLTFNPPHAYSGKLPVKKKVLNDLEWYLKKNLIPSEYTDYYKKVIQECREPETDNGVEDEDVPQEANDGLNISDCSDDDIDEPDEVDNDNLSNSDSDSFD